MTSAVPASSASSASSSSVAPSTIEVVALGPAHLDGFRALFEAAASPCFCRYWHFEGNKNEWLDRCAHRPEENFVEQAEAVRAGHDSARGLVAIDRSKRDEPGQPDGMVVGWMKLTPRAAVPKLRRLPVYRSLDLGPEEPTLSVGCFLIHPAVRRTRIASALLAAAESFARAWGATAVEGYPRRAAEPLYDEEAWQGPERIFIELGYEAIVDASPYPVYRKVLPASGH